MERGAVRELVPTVPPRLAYAFNLREWTVGFSSVLPFPFLFLAQTAPHQPIADWEPEEAQDEDNCALHLQGNENYPVPQRGSVVGVVNIVVDHASRSSNSSNSLARC